MSRGLLITGTDTGVGKTLVTAGLCAWLRARGRGVRPFKPVESGTNDFGGVPADSSLLAKCSGRPLSEVCIYSLPEPLAPVVAARRAGLSLDLVRIEEALGGLVETSDQVLVEGVGGARVEVVEGLEVLDLAARWDLDVLVVSANRLGVLSHTLLTVEALLHRGARVRGVVLNTLSEGAPTTAAQTNEGELRRLLPTGVPLLGCIGWVPEESQRDPEALAAALDPVAAVILSDVGESSIRG